MDLDIHKHSHDTKHWTNGELIKNSKISNFESCTLKFYQKEKHIVDDIKVILKEKGFTQTEDFSVSYMSQNYNEGLGTEWWFVETNTDMCDHITYKKIEKILKTFKNMREPKK